MTKSYIFSGHETFHCKSFWLKKGYNYAVQGKSFADDSAVMDLGVGKNMITSIKYWMRAFGLIDKEGEINSFAKQIFDEENGLDKYLEDRATLWLLHYRLISQNHASLYHLIFNDYHRTRNEFDVHSLEGFIRRKCSEINFTFNQNTVTKDIRTFIRNYVKPTASGNIDELYSTLLIDLELIFQQENLDSGNHVYYFNHQNATLPPYQLIVFLIISCFKDNTIDFRELMYGENPVGLILCLTENDMHHLLVEAMDKLKWIVYTEDAGNKQIQIKDRPADNWEILKSYYQSVQAK